MTRNQTHSSQKDISSYITKDGSEIRELMHPNVHGNSKQSLAEATILPGSSTRLHKHQSSEELYYILSGDGKMRIEDRQFTIAAGDTICIQPGAQHMVTNTGNQPLVILCCCAPPYSHEDTELL